MVVVVQRALNILLLKRLIPSKADEQCPFVVTESTTNAREVLDNDTFGKLKGLYEKNEEVNMCD